MKRLLAIAALVLAACPPSQHDPARYPPVRVHFPPNDWASSYVDQFRLAMQDAAALGPDFSITPDRASATVIVEHIDALGRCAQDGVHHVVGTNRVQIDPVCLSGNLFLRAAFIHEVGHVLGMSHICQHPGDAPDCVTTGFGVAVMNPALSYGDNSGPTFDTAYTGPAPQWFPTDLDLAEFRRTRP